MKNVNQGDALTFMVDVLSKNPDEFASYGYGLYVRNVAAQYIQREEQLMGVEVDRRLLEVSPVFFDAAWELCRRGIIRPGVKGIFEQSTDDGNAGAGYTVTPFGRQWLQDADRQVFVPTEPERFAQLLEPFKARFGSAFHRRAQEAIRCHNAGAYLACCVMCGAAGEAMLLEVGYAKLGEEKALSIYQTSRGRSQLQKEVTSGLPKPLLIRYQALTGLLDSWRDDSGHGKNVNIDENEAVTALSFLLRLAKLIDGDWTEFTKVSS